MGWLLSGTALIGLGVGVVWLRAAWLRSLDRCLDHPGVAGIVSFVVLRPVPWVLVLLSCLLGLAPLLPLPGAVAGTLVVWLLLAAAVGAATSDWPATRPLSIAD